MEIIVDNLNFRYSPDTVNETRAISGISLKISQGEFVGIIGPTGSGKSTFIQHLNGLLKPESGTVYCDKEDIFSKNYNLAELRHRVGMVFQYPEYQLFETTVLEDVKFGPKNQGLDDKNASIRAYEALEQLSFPRELIDQSPFDLSGGQKKLAAIAGVLAMKPEVLIFDEPTAGLDPRGKREILGTLKKLHNNLKATVILVSHSMEDVAEYVDRILVMNNGEIMYDGSVGQVFSHVDELKRIGLEAPDTVYLMKDLLDIGLPVNSSIYTGEKAVEEILKALK